MSAPAGEEIGLATAIANLYGGRLEDFVRRRDALAKELRSSGKQEAASTVKALRKPSRLAWALDLAALKAEGALDALVAAVAAMLDAQAADGDVRAAIVELRTVVREFASQAASAAEQAGYRLEPAVLANAVLAVLGRPDSFAALRRGCLADVPEAGGLDFLASLSLPPERVSQPPLSRPAAATPASAPSPERAEREAAARDAAQRAAIVLAAARERSGTAQRALQLLEPKVNAAEVRLRRAEDDARTVRGQRDRARQEAEAAATQLLEAERALAEAERRLDAVLGVARDD